MNNSVSTTSADWPTRWPQSSFRFWPTFFVIVAAAALGALVFGVGIVWIIFTTPDLRAGNVPIVPAILVQLVLELVVVLMLIIALPRLSGFSLRQLGFEAPKPWQVGIALLGAIAMVTVVEGGAALLEALTHHKHEQQVVEMFKHILGQPSLMWFFAIFAIVIAPMAEEAIFRVFFFNLGLRYGGFWTGAILSGLLFGAAHLDPFVLVPLALGGIVLCFVYYRTRNAYCSMITHGCFNALTVFAIIFAPQLAQ